MKEEEKDNWLNSDSFIKRSLAIAGHSFVGLLIVYVGLVLIAFVVGLLIGFIS